jgi:rhamnulokinase
MVTRVASHDTASAVVAVPAEHDRFAYISCGTWSLVGVELSQPVLTEASRAANFTNERGLDGTIRFLRNLTGLWPLQESLRAWGRPPAELPDLLAAAAQLPAFASVIDLDDPMFLPPGDMPARIVEACRHANVPVPTDHPGVVRCIVDSLANAHRRAIQDATRLSGHTVDVIHLIGGGAHNDLLCQTTADACGLPVIAGPTEATAIGNVLVQARTMHDTTYGLDDLRTLVRASYPTRIFRPR